MKRSQADTTTAKNLEDKLDRGENVLDYFEVRKARVVNRQSKASDKEKLAYPVKRNSVRRAIVREKSARYRQKEVESAALVTHH